MATVDLYVYRDFSNRQNGEPDDGPMAWAAHRERRRVIEELLSDGAFVLTKTDGSFQDEARPHELAELVIEILKEPTAQIVLSTAALYVGRVVAKQFDELVSHGVRHVFQKLLNGFRAKTIGDYGITLPDGSRITLAPDSTVSIDIRGGEVVSFHYDAVPKTV